jgi:hypothetical protein
MSVIHHRQIPLDSASWLMFCTEVINIHFGSQETLCGKNAELLKKSRW